MLAVPKHPRSFPPASESRMSELLILGLLPCGKIFLKFSIPIQVRAAPVSKSQLVECPPILQEILGLNVFEEFINEKIEQICKRKAEIAFVGVFTIVVFLSRTPEWSSVESEISLNEFCWNCRMVHFESRR